MFCFSLWMTQSCIEKCLQQRIVYTKIQIVGVVAMLLPAVELVYELPVNIAKYNKINLNILHIPYWTATIDVFNCCSQSLGWSTKVSQQIVRFMTRKNSANLRTMAICCLTAWCNLNSRYFYQFKLLFVSNLCLLLIVNSYWNQHPIV